jgi:hypothetical protein
MQGRGIFTQIFGIVAPRTPEITALEEYRGSYSFSIAYGKMLNIGYI